jgi:hypothetical protein
MPASRVGDLLGSPSPWPGPRPRPRAAAPPLARLAAVAKQPGGSPPCRWWAPAWSGRSAARSGTTSVIVQTALRCAVLGGVNVGTVAWPHGTPAMKNWVKPRLSLSVSCQGQPTFMVSAHIAGWYGDAASPLYLFPFAAMFGGVAQLAAGMWAHRARDAIATAVHGMWGSFWLAYGILYLLAATGDLASRSASFLGWGSGSSHWPQSRPQSRLRRLARTSASPRPWVRWRVLPRGGWHQTGAVALTPSEPHRHPPSS